MQSLLAKLKAANKQSAGTNEVQVNGITGADAEESTKTISIPNGLQVSEISVIKTETNTDQYDDEMVIDVVMETNKVQKNLLSPSTPTPRPMSKSSRRNGSRTSLNSAALSDKDELETINLDSDDELPKEEEISSAQAWAAFENCVKNIDNSTSEDFAKKPKPNFISSGTFQQVMVDMYGNTEYGNTKGYTVLKQKLNNMGKSLKLASRMMQSAVNKGQAEREKMEDKSEDDVDNNEAMETHVEPESASKVLAKRGWRLLKRDMNENVMEQKTQSKKLNWTMLQHTVKQMSNTEKTRQDLYERYGVVPRTLQDGTVVCENMMLSERARAQIYGQNGDTDNKRPSSHKPSSVHLRSRSQIGYQNKRTDSPSSYKSLKLPHLNRSKARPFTAK